MEPLDLVQQLADAFGLGSGQGGADGSGLAVGPQHDDVADLAVLDPVEQFLPRLAVAAHQADADLEVLLLRLFAQGQHPAGRRAVDRDRLLHEGVDALLDRVAEVDPAEGRRRGEDDDVARLEAVHRLLVAVEADELVVAADFDLVAVFLLELFIASVEPVLEDVGHGDELDGACLVESALLGRAGAAAAAADQGHADRVVLGRVDHRHGNARQRRGRRDLRRSSSRNLAAMHWDWLRS